MASNTPSRPARGFSTKSSRKSPRPKTTPQRKRSAGSASKKPGAAKAGSKKTAGKHEISPAARKQWNKLTQRWKNLLPKLTKGKGGAKRRTRLSACR